MGVAAWFVHIYIAGWRPTLGWRTAGLPNVLSDNTLTQADFVIGGLQFEWHENCLGTGLDHRCVHSILRIRVAKRTLAKRMSGLKKLAAFLWTVVVKHRVSNRLHGNYCEQTEILHCLRLSPCY